MTDEFDDDQLLKIVKQYATRLSEHFSTVQIFVTTDPRAVGEDAGDTHSLRWGIGNHFARVGQVRDYIKELDAGMLAQAIEDLR